MRNVHDAALNTCANAILLLDRISEERSGNGKAEMPFNSRIIIATSIQLPLKENVPGLCYLMSSVPPFKIISLSYNPDAALL